MIMAKKGFVCLNMDVIRIKGGYTLNGYVTASGSKNASLPILAAALLTEEALVLNNISQLKDIHSMCELLNLLGCEIAWTGENSLECHVRDESLQEASYDVVRKMRASICVLGPLLAKRGRARVSLPGGCVIGARPVDLHLKGLEALGASVSLDGGYIEAYAEHGLRGAEMDLTGPQGSSVLATANTVMAAVLASGQTVIHGAAREPEIVDLCACLLAMGAQIEGAGTETIRIEGVSQLHGATHAVIPDRIEVGTLLLAGVVTGGKVTVRNCCREHILSLLQVFDAMGIMYDSAEDEITVYPSESIQAMPWVNTAPYPGFPTDLQAQLMVALCRAEGHSMIKESIYPERFLHAAELNRMGADVNCHNGEAQISGPQLLNGADVMSSDLRASAALIMAGLVAEGETNVHRVYHLDRGYENLEQKLTQLGASIERVKETVSV